VRVEPAEPKTPGLQQPRQKLVWPDGSSYDEGTLSSEQRASVVSLYDSGIAYADNAFGQLLTRLRKLRLEHDTLVILTSDHGEALGEHGRIGHEYLAEEDFRVPLVFAFPRRLEKARVISARARSVDILPTVVDLLGLPPLSGIDGVSLVPLMQSDS
jgi:arylsulfatase A-like enzyme